MTKSDSAKSANGPLKVHGLHQLDLHRQVRQCEKSVGPLFSGLLANFSTLSLGVRTPRDVCQYLGRTTRKFRQRSAKELTRGLFELADLSAEVNWWTSPRVRLGRRRTRLESAKTGGLLADPERTNRSPPRRSQWRTPLRVRFGPPDYAGGVRENRQTLNGP